MFKWMIGPNRLNDYGDGYNSGPSEPNRPIYFYLIIDGRKSKALSQDDIQAFYRTGVNTGPEFSFTLVDISTDSRLEADLNKHPSGISLLKDLEYYLPAIVISDGPLNHIDQTRHVHITRIEQYDQDIEVIFERMGLPKNKSRRAAIRFLRKLNDYGELKPNIAGVGLNFNAMLSDAIQRLERDIP